jgi:ABC-type sugar transport system ATPase subunit
VEQVGAPLEVYANPANMFVAGFLASPPMNFLPARLLAAGDGLSLQLAPGLSWPVPAPHAAAWGGHVGAPVVLGLRPEDLHLQEAPGRIGLELAVTAVEALGPETIVTGTLAALGLPPLRARLGRGLPPRTGETLRLFADLIPAHLFDPDTQAVIPRPPGGGGT